MTLYYVTAQAVKNDQFELVHGTVSSPKLSNVMDVLDDMLKRYDYKLTKIYSIEDLSTGELYKENFFMATG